MRAVFTCGRFNPPTIGHRRLVDALYAEAQKTGAVARLFATASQDRKRNPLGVEPKLDFLRRAFPEVTVGMSSNIFAAAEKISSEGYTEATLVLGSDRGDVGDRLIRHAASLGLTVDLMTLDRHADDPSATEARRAIEEGDEVAFMRLAACTDPAWVAEVIALVRQGMKE